MRRTFFGPVSGPVDDIDDNDIGIPELDLLITFFGGNYSDPIFYRSQDVLVPEFILKAVDAREN